MRPEADGGFEAPLWRALAVFRVAALVYALILIVHNDAGYAHQVAAWIVGAAMTLWTGMSYKQIAERLTLSHRTVQNHVQNTLQKLQLHNRAELVRYAIESGLDEPQHPVPRRCELTHRPGGGRTGLRPARSREFARGTARFAR